MFLDNFAGMPVRQQRELLSSATITGADPYAPSLAYFQQVNGTSGILGRLLHTDIKTYLVELLMKQDQMSMSASIESRVPFLDHVLVEFAARLPDRLKLRGFTTKRILREAIRGLLPEEILSRKKMGFPVPFAEWTRERWQPVVRDVLLDRRTRERGFINARAVERLLDAHRVSTVNGGDAIWALMNFELWFRTFIDGEGVQTLPSAGRDSGSGVRDWSAPELGTIESRIPIPNPESRIPNEEHRHMKVSIFGLGYVGSVSAASFAADGHDVVGVDVNSNKVTAVNNGHSPIVEPGLDGLLRSGVESRRLRATTSTAEAIAETDLSLVCVSTRVEKMAVST